jgi:translation elongation factor EF-G
MPILIEGLKKLNKSDPAVDYYVQDNGEHILVTAGEVHLERCIKDLEDHLAKINFKISTPIVNFKEGLNNQKYIHKKKKKDQKIIDSIDKKEKKMDFMPLEYYQGEENIDIDDQEEILKSSTPIIVTHKDANKPKKPEKIKHKVDDIKNKSEKTDQFIEKTRKEEKKEVIGYAEDKTPNELCSFAISAVGMSKEVIDHIEKHENLLRDVYNKNFVVNNELYKKIELFKETLLNLVEDKKLKKLIENNLYCFNPNNYGPNMLIIRNINKSNNYFSKIVLEESLTTANANDSCQVTNDNEEKSVSIVTGIKTSLEDELSKNINEQFSIGEFFIAIKSGCDYATRNGPLCEENLYGVIFVIEEIVFNKKYTSKGANNPITTPTNINSINLSTGVNINENITNTNENIANNINTHHEDSQNITNNVNAELKKPESIQNEAGGLTNDLQQLFKEPEQEGDLNFLFAGSEQERKPKTEEVKEEYKTAEDKSLSSKYNIFGPFLGQVIGTIKDCCRKAFINGEPRLYEAMYLCTFQISNENIGKIHSVINKRRGCVNIPLNLDYR